MVDECLLIFNEIDYKLVMMTWRSAAPEKGEIGEYKFFILF